MHGVLASEVADANKFFFFRHIHKRPFITIKIASSSDGMSHTEDGSITMGGSLNIGRVCHGMGTIKINGKERLIVFGGETGARNANSSVELYNAETDQWEMADFTIDEPRFAFGCVTV